MDTKKRPIDLTVAELCSSPQQPNRSHACAMAGRCPEQYADDLKVKIQSRGDLPHASVRRQLEMVDDLRSFPFGQYLLDRRGANGYWTDFLISYPNLDRRLGHGSIRTPASPTEDFLLNRSPVVVAHRERNKMFKVLMQRFVKPDAVLASIPCGLMRDLLTLDYSAAPGVELYGIDIDPDALELARYLAKLEGIDGVHLLEMDAWSMPYEEKFDAISSSGLNVYESDRDKVIDLYKGFRRALKPGGALVTSVLTYPPAEGKAGDWATEIMVPDDVVLEKMLHQDILDLKWQNFRSVEELTDDFRSAGFTDVSIHFDRGRVFPTIFAQK